MLNSNSACIQKHILFYSEKGSGMCVMQVSGIDHQLESLAQNQSSD